MWEKHCKMWLIRMAEDKRDIFGFCYNNLCEYVFECIINFDFDSFSKYYVKLFGISTISEFGIKDVVKDIGINDIAKFRYQISGLDMLFEISGYAIIVGDILKTNCWKKLIDDTLKKTLIVEESNGVQNVEQIKRWKDIIAVVSKNFGFLHMIDITNMNLRFKEAINGSGKLEYENVGMFGHKRVINSQNLAMLYYDDTGFSVEMREIYAIATLNRYLPISERYESKRLKIKEWIDLND